MDDLNRLPNRLNKANKQCKAIVETPKGRRNKFKYLPDTGMFSLSHVLPQGFSFPFDFGFIPSTSSEDGDPLDIIVLMDEPAHVGCLLDVRLIGVMKVVQTEDGKQTQNDRLLGVAVHTFEFAQIESVDQLPKTMLEQFSDFLALYNKNSGKQDEVQGLEGPEAALKLLEQASATFASGSGQPNGDS